MERCFPPTRLLVSQSVSAAPSCVRPWKLGFASSSVAPGAPYASTFYISKNGQGETRPNTAATKASKGAHPSLKCET